MKKLIILILVVTGINGLIYAGEGTENEKSHPNHLAVFIGATTNPEAEQTNFTLGIDYEYKVGEKTGIGVLGEAIFAEHKEIIIGIPLFYHLQKVKLFVAPGILSTTEEDDHETEKVVKGLVRIGTSFDIDVSGVSIAPTLSADFIDGNISLIYGIGIGKGF